MTHSEFKIADGAAPQFAGGDAFVVTRDGDHMVRLRDPLNGAVFAELPIPEGDENFSASADGRWLALSNGASTELYEVRSERPETTLPVAYQQPVESADLSPDGRYAAWYEQDARSERIQNSRVGFVDVDSGNVVWEQPVHVLEHAPSLEWWFKPTVRFDPSGQHVAVSDPALGIRIEGRDGTSILPRQIGPGSEESHLQAAADFDLIPDGGGELTSDSSANGGQTVKIDCQAGPRQADVRVPESWWDGPGTDAVGVYARVGAVSRKGQSPPPSGFDWEKNLPRVS